MLKYLYNNIIKKYYIYILLIITILILGIKLNYEMGKRNKLLTDPIVVENGDSGRYSVIYYSQDSYKWLKSQNQDLYDSLKKYKNQIDFITQFNYYKEYKTDTVVVDTTSVNEDVAVYEYTNEPNDSLQYNLTIGSTVPPRWYMLKMSVADQFTIVNKSDGDLNNTSIESKNGGELSSVIVYNPNTSTKQSFWNRFSIGPSVTTGYCINNKNLDVMFGFSVTYNILKK